MSFCIRIIPNKLSSFVNTRNQLIQLDHRLIKFVNMSAFTHETSSNTLRRDLPHRMSFNTLEECSCNIVKSGKVNWNNSNVILLSTKSMVVKMNNPMTKATHNNEAPVNNSEQSSGPTEEQLKSVYNTLRNDLPNFFTAPLDYRIYHKDIEFVNHVKGVVSNGLPGYMKQILSIRFMGHLAYVYVKFDILKITIHPEDNTIRVRWRIRGLSSLKAILNFWRFKWLQLSNSIKSQETWHDGFSTFFIGTDGKVYKHIADKMMPDDETVQDKAKTDIAAKLTA